MESPRDLSFSESVGAPLQNAVSFRNIIVSHKPVVPKLFKKRPQFKKKIKYASTRDPKACIDSLHKNILTTIKTCSSNLILTLV